MPTEVVALVRWSATATDAVRAIGVLPALLAQPVAPLPGMEGRP